MTQGSSPSSPQRLSQSPPVSSLWRYLPLLAGGIGSGILIINRIGFTPDLVSSQSRSDAIGILLSVLLILTGLVWRQIQPQAPESVALVGEPQFELNIEGSESLKMELGWLSKSILKLTSARSVVIWVQGTVILRRGVFPVLKPRQELMAQTIMTRAMSTQRAIYLVDLKLFPAKAEFTTYFPENTQSVLCQPIASQGVVIVGTDTPRSLTQRDQAWIEALAEKLAYQLSLESQPNAETS